jgi:hypothetical protein
MRTRKWLLESVSALPRAETAHKEESRVLSSFRTDCARHATLKILSPTGLAFSQAQPLLFLSGFSQNFPFPSLLLPVSLRPAKL